MSVETLVDWEVTDEDLVDVLKAHVLNLAPDYVSRLFADLRLEEIRQAALQYTELDDQCAATLCAIEDQLISLGAIDKIDKLFEMP